MSNYLLPMDGYYTSRWREPVHQRVPLVYSLEKWCLEIGESWGWHKEREGSIYSVAAVAYCDADPTF